MNHVHKTRWSEASQCWQAVPETAKSAGKSSVKSTSAGVLATALLGLAMYGSAEAQSPPVAINQLPTGGTVARGTATINQTATAQAATMTVNQSSQCAVINWDSFNLGQAANINFVQANAQAVTLNRVNDNNPSQIFGRITANGQVFLSNANGVYFSPTSSVDVGALVATTHSIRDDNFMAGKYQFERNDATGKVVNEGHLSAALGGYVALLAPEVQNAGVVVARAGTVALAAGEVISLQLQNGSLANITTTPSSIATLIENKLAVQAPDGQIILSAVALKNLQAGVIKNSGSLEVNSLVSKGGKVFLESDTIHLNSTSQISAKGPQGGGTVLVGGDWQGSGTLRPATQVTMAAGATIDASATDNGNGGKVVLWSDVHNADSMTRVNGSIKAEAGPNGGDGGQIETSGHSLHVGELAVSAKSFKGNDGLWLLDPYDITISSGADASTSNADNTFTSSVTGGVVNTTTLQNALALNDVTVSTTGAGTATGNITLSNNLVLPTSTTLTLSAAGGVTGSGGVALTGGGALVIDQAGTSTYTGVISGTGSFKKDGVGTLSLTTASTFTGGSTVAAGVLKLVFGSAGSGRLTVLSGAALDAVGNLSNPLTINGTGINNTGALTYSTAGQAMGPVLSGLLTLGSDSFIKNNIVGKTFTFTNAGTIVGNGYALTLGGIGTISIYSIIGPSVTSITKVGVGSLWLGGVNTFTGNVYVNEGELSANNNSALGTTAGSTIVASGASLSLSVVAGPNFAEPLTLSGFGLSDTLAALYYQSAATTLNYTGAITLNGTTRIGVMPSKTLNITNTVNNGIYDILKYSTGTLNLQGLPQTGVAAPSIGLSGTGVLKTGYAFVKPSGSPSVYGSDPNISYQLYTSRAGVTLSTGVPTISGNAVFTDAPTSTSVPGNYSLTYTGGLSSDWAFFPLAAATTWVVGKAPLTITAGSASKTYGDANPTLTYTLSGFVNNETLATSGVSGTGTATTTATATTGAGTAVVTAGVGSLTASNYNFSNLINGTLTINKYPLTISGLTASHKVYDGTDSAVLGGVATISPINGDLVTLSGSAVGTYADKNVGTAKPITVAGLGITGTSADNYTLGQQNGLTADIVKAPLTVTANNATKTYGDANPALSTTVSGFVNGETLTTSGVSGAGAATTTATASTGAGTAVITAAVGSLTASNYDFITLANGVLTINKAPLTVTANNATKTYGDANPSLSATVSGFVNGETLATSGLSGAGAATTTATASTGAGTAVITAAVGSLAASNYDFSNVVNGTLTINKAPLTVTANNASKTYGDANPALSTTVSSFVNNETLATSGVSGAGTAVINAAVGSLAASNYDFSNLVNGTLTIEAALPQANSNSNTSASVAVSTAQAIALVAAPVINTALSEPPTAPTALTLPVPPGPPPQISVVPEPTVVATLPPTTTNDDTDNTSNKAKAASTTARTSAAPSLQGEQVTYLRPAEVSAPTAAQVAPIRAETARPLRTPLAAPAGSGVLAITILHGNSAQPTSAGVAFEQSADTVSLRTTNAPNLPPLSGSLVFKDTLTTFMVVNPMGAMVEFQGSLVNNSMVIVAPSYDAKQLAQSDMNTVLAAAVTSLGRESRIMLAQLDRVVLDLR